MRKHIHLNLASVLKNWDARDWQGVCQNPQGDYLSPDEVKEIFKELLADGARVYPCCAFDACPDFDYQTGCPGHNE